MLPGRREFWRSSFRAQRRNGVTVSIVNIAAPFIHQAQVEIGDDGQIIVVYNWCGRFGQKKARPSRARDGRGVQSFKL